MTLKCPTPGCTPAFFEYTPQPWLREETGYEGTLHVTRQGDVEDVDGDGEPVDDYVLEEVRQAIDDGDLPVCPECGEMAVVA